MNTTSDFIMALAADLTPVQRPLPPVIQAACWLLLATFLLTALAIDPEYSPASVGLARNFIHEAVTGVLPTYQGQHQTRAATEQALARP